MNTPTFVVDASTTLKWIFDDEVFSNEAIILQKSFLSERVTLLAPSLWQYEITNGIKSAVVRERLSDEKAHRALGLLLECQPTIIPLGDILAECLTNAIRFQISVYDSCYVTLALIQRVVFITADQKLSSKINSLEKGAAVPLSQLSQLRPFTRGDKP